MKSRLIFLKLLWVDTSSYCEYELLRFNAVVVLRFPMSWLEDIRVLFVLLVFHSCVDRVRFGVAISTSSLRG